MKKHEERKMVAEMSEEEFENHIEGLKAKHILKNTRHVIMYLSLLLALLTLILQITMFNKVINIVLISITLLLLLTIFIIDLVLKDNAEIHRHLCPLITWVIYLTLTIFFI